MTIPPILKNKWVLIGGAAVVVIALVASGGGGGGGTSIVASGPSDAEIAASRDITLAQLNAQVQQGAANAQLAAITQQGQIEMARAGIESQLAQYAIDAQTAIQSMQVSTSRDVELASLSSIERRELAGINAQSQMQKWALDAQFAMLDSNNDFQLQYAEAANTTNVMLASMQAELVNNQLIANRDVTLAGLATQEQLSAINAALQRDVTYSNNATQAAIYTSMMNSQTEMTRIGAVNETERARIMASVEKKKSSNNLLGGIVGGVLGMFSDPRLKVDIELIEREPDGVGIYRYRYAGDDAEYTGVMADEIALIRPQAIGPMIDGYATVRYDRL